MLKLCPPQPRASARPPCHSGTAAVSSARGSKRAFGGHIAGRRFVFRFEQH